MEDLIPKAILLKVVYVMPWTHDIALRKSFILMGDFSLTFINLTVNQNC